MSAQSIPGYSYGSPDVPPAPISLDELERLKATLLFTADDVAALRQAGEILGPQVDAILDVWYGFVGSHPFLLHYFTSNGQPDGRYLERVRARFGQWIIDTCRAEYDQDWLNYQIEIGRRHVTKKGEVDGVLGTPPLIHFRYVNALIYPIFATIRPFLERSGEPAEVVERMHQAWLKSVILQTTLWSQPYLPEGAF